MGSKCSVSGCRKSSMARGLCQMHYMRFRRANPGAPRLYKYGRSLAEKVSELYSAGDPSECWIWRGAKSNLGYGRVPDGDGVMRLAHRAVWEVRNNAEIPAGMVAMHICDTPSCVNPGHIRFGTQADNLRDMREKRRGYDGFAIEPIRGEDHHCARFTVEQVREIRACAKTISARTLAKKFGVNPASITKIRSRKTWKHID